MLRFTRVHSLRTFFRHFCALCTVDSCWYIEKLCAFSIAIIIINWYEFTLLGIVSVFEHFLNIFVLCALCSLVERGVLYREMLCAFSIAIIIINSQLKSKQPGNIFTPLGNLHDFFFTSTKEKKSPLLIIISR